MSGRTSLTIIGGSKGGVGKSLVTMAVVDWLTRAKSKRVLLIDGDDSNPDVCKAYTRELDPEPGTISLDLREGWLALADRCAHHPDAHVVVNTGARSLDAMLRYSGPVTTGVTTELQREVTLLWVINAERDSVELLRRYVDAVSAVDTPIRLHVVCNEGEEEGRSFAFYEGTTTAKLVADAGGKSVVMPTLAKRATTLLYTERKPIRVVAEGDPENSVPFGTRIEMSRWRTLVWACLETLRLDEG